MHVSSTIGEHLPHRGGAWDAARGAAAIAYYLVGSPWLRELYNRWGTSREEWLAPMPGDDLVLTAIGQQSGRRRTLLAWVGA